MSGLYMIGTRKRSGSDVSLLPVITTTGISTPALASTEHRDELGSRKIRHHEVRDDGCGNRPLERGEEALCSIEEDRPEPCVAQDVGQHGSEIRVIVDHKDDVAGFLV